MISKKEIVDIYFKCANIKKYDLLRAHVAENFRFQHHDGPEFGWERNLDSLQDHANKIILGVIPDAKYRIKHFIESEDEIWVLAEFTATLTGKVDFGDYIDSNRDATHQRFATLVTLIFIFEDNKLSKIKSFPQMLDVLLKMNAVQFVYKKDSYRSYIRKLREEGFM